MPWLSRFGGVVDDEDVCVTELPLVESEGPDVLGVGEEEEILGVLIVAFALDIDDIRVRVSVGVVVMAARVAEYALHSFVPAVYACCKSAALQAATKHSPTASAARLHWQETSLGAQPATEIAETRQDV